MPPLLIVDCDYVTNRSFYAMAQIAVAGRSRGDGSKFFDSAIVYRFFQDVLSYMDHWQTTRVAFCFDVGAPLRKQLCPGYKANRRKSVLTMSQAEKDVRDSYYRQMRDIRTKWLPLAGLGLNTFGVEGYEADDLIAVLANKADSYEGTETIIVSSDKDLYQLFRPWTFMYDPGKKDTLRKGDFFQKYGIRPDQWPMVKAMAGCNSDNIKGVPGVGEVTAIKFIRGSLPIKTKAFRSIVDNKPLVESNMKLVKLPFMNTPSISYQDDDADWTPSRVDPVCGALGLDPITIAGVDRSSAVRFGKKVK